MTSEHRRSMWRWPRVIWYGAGLALLVAAAAVFWGVGRWLVVQDDLAPADVIVVLSGRMPIRALEAAELYRQSVAPRVWVTRPRGPAQDLQQMGIAYVGEEFYSAKVLLARGVPPDAVRVLEKETGNTADELAEVIRLLRQEGGHRAVVVTSKPHTRRVRAIWNRLARATPGESAPPRLIVRYATIDPYDGAHWWRSTRDALDVVREVLGLCNTWAGFPVHAPEH